MNICYKKSHVLVQSFQPHMLSQLHLFGEENKPLLLKWKGKKKSPPRKSISIINQWKTVLSQIALTKIVKDRMKMMSEALPSKLISFLATDCPKKEATVATATEYRAVLEIKDDEFWKKLVSDANIACDSSLGAQMLISKLLNIRDSKTFQKVIFFFFSN